MDLSFPAMRVKMGRRTMFSATAEAPSLVQLAAKPNEWNPLATTPHGNRIRSKDHVKGIVDYLLHEEDPILGAIVSVLSLAGVVWWALGQEPPTLPDTPARWAALAGAIGLYGVATCVRG